MTVLRFPTKVSLTVVAGQDCEPLVAAAVNAADAALSRAVRRAGELHLVRDARRDPKRLPLIDVSFRGADLPPGLAERLRVELAALAAARASELRARPNVVTSAAARDLGPNESAAEPFDDASLVPDQRTFVDDAYLVPSYNDQGSKVALPLTGGSRGQAVAGNAAQPMHLRLTNIASPDELRAQIARRYGGSPPPLLVAIYRDAGRPITVLLRVDPAGDVLGAHIMGALSAYNAPSGEGTGRWHPTSVYGVDAIEFDSEATTSDERRQTRENMWVAGLRVVAGTIRISDATLKQQAAAIVRTMPDPGGVTSYYWLLSHGVRLQLMEVEGPHTFKGRLPVAVFSEQVSDTGGHDGGSGDGDTDPPLPLSQLSWFDPDPAHAFLGEPPVEFWPPGISAYLTELIADAAAKLGMLPGRFPGMFAIAAVAKMKDDARGLGPLAGSGTQGDSPRMAAIRLMAAATATIEQMQRFYVRVIAGAAETHTLVPPLRHNSASWMLHFHEEYIPRRNDAVGALFVATCQDILLDVLETSHVQILQRQQNFPAYMRITRALILLMLVDDPQLTRLRQALEDKTSGTVASVLVGGVGGVGAGGSDKIAAWFGSTRLVIDALGDVEVATDGPPEEGRVRRTQDGWQVQDSIGRWWTRAELDSVIAGGRQQAYAVDPLLEKIADLPDTVDQLRAAGAAGVDDAFKALLDDLRAENESKTQDVRDDVDIAFGLASFKESDITTTSSIGAQLSGIHAQADAALRPLFTGDSEHAYVIGMRALVDSELGKASLFGFLNVVGLTALAIFCPPAAFAIGAVEAASSLGTAIEHRGIQRAMLGGDAILSKAQAEAELWGAAIGAALVFIPEIPGAIRGVSGGVGAVVRGEVREAATVAGEQLVKRAAAHLAEIAAEDLARVFATECLKSYLLNLAIEGAINRFTDAVAREVAARGHASISDLPQLIGDAISGPPQAQP